MHPAEAYDYLVEARERLFDRVVRLSQRQYTRIFPFGHHSIRATLVHVLDSEAWYARMLAGEREPRQSPLAALRTSSFPALRTAWTDQTRRTREVLGRHDGPDRPIEHVSVAGRIYTHVVRATTGGSSSSSCSTRRTTARRSW